MAEWLSPTARVIRVKIAKLPVVITTPECRFYTLSFFIYPSMFAGVIGGQFGMIRDHCGVIGGADAG